MTVPEGLRGLLGSLTLAGERLRGALALAEELGVSLAFLQRSYPCWGCVYVCGEVGGGLWSLLREGGTLGLHLGVGDSVQRR